MNEINYEKLPYAVRDDLVAAQNAAWGKIAAPGDWLDGQRRVNVAREVRQAFSCSLCAERKEALSPYAVDGTHDSATDLSSAEIDMIHRLATDPGRTSRKWVDDILAGGLSQEEYIEIVSIVCIVMVTDSFTRAVGAPDNPLPEPLTGGTAGYRSLAAQMHGTWLPYVEMADVAPEDGHLYDNPQEPPVVKALSLVPDAKRAFWNLADANYLPATEVFNLETDLRAINRMQMEVLAARVSSVHQCTY